jgi:DNA modification methylase
VEWPHFVSSHNTFLRGFRLSTSMQIEMRAVSELVPFARNSRTHSDEQVAQIASSIREFGFTNPILIREDGGIIAGHGRLMAARKLGLAEVPTICLAHLSEAQVRAYVIADNKLALNAGWDEDMLRLELGELADLGFDLALTGFEDEELARVLAQALEQGLTDPDEAPSLEERAIACEGDVWQLGRHRIACGSSTDAATVSRLLGDVRPHLMVTDPPYGVEYDPGWRKEAGVGSEGQALGKVLNDDIADWREAWALFPGDVAYVWHAGTRAGEVAESLAAVRFKLRAQIVWVKTRHVLSRGDYHHQHEPALYATRDGAEDQWRFVPEHEIATYAVKAGKVGHWNGGRKQSTVWFIEHLKSDTGHGTQKPVECMKRPIENNSSPGQAVYEPFSGSGTTIIACEMTGRSCFAIELNPAYVDVAVRRWQEFTGKAALLDGDGRTFAEVEAAGRG